MSKPTPETCSECSYGQKLIRAAVEAETERCCTYLCHLCREHGAPARVKGYWRHEVAGGTMSFGCFAAAIRARGEG